MAGAMGWSAADLGEASLAEVWAHWIGYAQAQGWLGGGGQMSREEAAELREWAFGEAA